MPDFDRPSFLGQTPGRGGAILKSDPAAILRACEDIGPVFVLFRNEVCIFGSVADPLWYLEIANVHLAASGAITLNLSPNRRCNAYAYLETGTQGGWIDAIEFCDAGQSGFLKVCRMEQTDRKRWLALLAAFHSGDATASRIAAIRKTNHLDPLAVRFPSPAQRVLERFLDCSVSAGALLHFTAQSDQARGRLVISPTHRVQAGRWTVLSSDETACHLACGAVSELRVITRPHLVQLILFGERRRFLARILCRDRAVLNQLPHIL